MISNWVLDESTASAAATYLRQTCREHNNLKVFAHSTHKLIDARSLKHIDIVHLVLDLHRDNIVRLRNHLKSIMVSIWGRGRGMSAASSCYVP